MEALKERANRLLGKLQELHKDETILLVGHEDINRALISAVEGEMPDALANTGVTIYRINGKAIREAFDCTAHL